MTDRVERRPFGRLPDGREVEAVMIAHEAGLAATVLSYGATLARLEAPDPSGRRANVVLGFATLEAYLRSSAFIGATVGRYANRIGGARLAIDGTTHRLTANEGENTLHGGARGFDKALWRIEPGPAGTAHALRLTHVSPHGDEGFPGRLEVTLDLTLSEDRLRFDYRARCDRPTVVNLSNHAYFNLAGDGAGDILGHELEIDAERFTPIDAQLLPTGEQRDVAGTPFDFRRAQPIGARIAADDEQLRRARGYDHNFVLHARAGAAPARAARLREPRSGRTMEVWTTEPGVQFYSGNFLDGSDIGAAGAAYRRHAGLCLETQHFPDSPNRSDFPSTLLRPGEEYRTTTELRFPRPRP